LVFFALVFFALRFLAMRFPLNLFESSQTIRFAYTVSARFRQNQSQHGHVGLVLPGSRWSP